MIPENVKAIIGKFQDKSTAPDRAECPICKNKVVYFWLESDAPEKVPSSWVPHLCICRITAAVVFNANQFLTQAERIKQVLTGEEKITEARSNNLRMAQDQFQGRATAMTGLLRELNTIRRGGDPNEVIRAQRFELARRYGAWRILTDCEDEVEAMFYKKVIELEQPKPEQLGILEAAK